MSLSKAISPGHVFVRPPVPDFIFYAVNELLQKAGLKSMGGSITLMASDVFKAIMERMPPGEFYNHYWTTGFIDAYTEAGWQIEEVGALGSALGSCPVKWIFKDPR